MKSDLPLWPGSHTGNYRIWLLLKCLIQLLTAPHVTLWLCAPGGSARHLQTHPVSSWPLKLKQLLGRLSIQGTRNLTLWCCLSLPLWNASDWAGLSKPPHSALASAQFLGCSLHPPLLTPETDFVKGTLFFFILIFRSLSHKCLALTALQQVLDALTAYSSTDKLTKKHQATATPSWHLLPVPSQRVQLCCSPAEPSNWNCS